MKTLRSCIVGAMAGALVVGCGGGANLPTVPSGSATAAPSKSSEPDPKGKKPVEVGPEASGDGAVKPK